MTPFPLAWPEGMPRHKGTRESSQFRTGLSSALENARKSLTAFGKDSGIPVSEIVFSSNVGGLDERSPSDPGIALWFKWDGAQRCVAVDRYSKPEANLQAIHHILEADRTKLRHGSLEIVRASFKGFIALPAPPGKKSWREVLGILPDASVTKETITAAYRLAAQKAHPDQGGSNDAMSLVNAAKADALKAIGA